MSAGPLIHRSFDHAIPSTIDIPTSDRQEGCKTTRFWLDSSVLKGVLLLQGRGAYAGRIRRLEMPHRFCVQEDPCERASLLPYHIASLSSYTEKDCRRLFREVLESVQLLHSDNVAHRYLNLNQISFHHQKERLQLSGLRYAAQMPDDGTPLVSYAGPRWHWYAFRAPETEGDKPHTTKADIWSLGVMLYIMCTGVAPFRGTKLNLVERKRRGQFDFDFAAPSESCQELVRSMLRVDPDQRPSLAQVLEHEWMTEPIQLLERSELSLARALFQDWHLV